nr:unnamed protein product [Spirometra erinaceieuropaei]
MFADDIKLWSVIRTADDEEHLQENLNRLQQWSKAWLLPFNEKKCNILRVGRARSPNHMAYCLNGIPLQEVDSQKDLGVWITTSLKPSLHCTKIAKSAMSVLYLVKRAFSAFDEDCFAKVFRTFVRPQLEFAIQAWRPWTSKDLSILERVQRRATKLVAGQGSLPYATRSYFQPAYRARIGLVGHRRTHCAIKPTTPTSSLTLAPAAHPALTATAVTIDHTVAAPPPPPPPPPPPSALPQPLHRLQRPASAPRLHALPPPMGRRLMSHRHQHSNL